MGANYRRHPWYARLNTITPHMTRVTPPHLAKRGWGRSLGHSRPPAAMPAACMLAAWEEKRPGNDMWLGVIVGRGRRDAPGFGVPLFKRYTELILQGASFFA